MFSFILVCFLSRFICPIVVPTEGLVNCPFNYVIIYIFLTFCFGPFNAPTKFPHQIKHTL